MCNLYRSTSGSQAQPVWKTGNPLAIDWPGGIVGPRKNGLFIRPVRGGDGLEMVIGRWGLIPWFADTADIRYSTNNARAEEVAHKPSFKLAWQRGQRCIIPADWFDEPNWETGRNVWWRFRRADGAPWGLAGLWSAWTDRRTGEVIESYTLLTINADHHPVMRRMHKPDPALPAEAQDKRSVIAIEAHEVERWLHGPVEQARGLLQPPAEPLLRHGPAQVSPSIDLPGF